MAYIQGSPVDGLKQTVTRHLFLMGVVSLLLAGIMIATSENPKGEVGVIFGVTLACTGLIAFVSLRSNPLALSMLFRPHHFKEAVRQEERAMEAFQGLPDDCYLFNNIILELFRVDHLVVSTRGIFVVGRIRKPGALHIHNGHLYADGHCQESLTSSTWRICHLLNIVIQKGWSKEVMPRPLIAARPDTLFSPLEIDGISVDSLHEIAKKIKNTPKGALDQELAESLAAYILKRYAK
ncbi:MAG: NERD domain-containing protein [Desulfobacterales bacterium]|nr:NERD domain-containing protein [Desulfobacterales bacterium]